MSAAVIRATKKAEAADNTEFFTAASAVAKIATGIANVATESSSSEFYLIVVAAGHFIYAYGVYFLIATLAIIFYFVISLYFGKGKY